MRGLSVIAGGVLLAAASACGSPDGGEGSGGAGGSTGEGCVDLALNNAMLDDPDAWLWRGDALPGGPWVAGNEVHFAWVAYRSYPEGTAAQFLNDTVPWLIVTTFSPVDGVILENRRYKVFPEGLQYGDGAIRSVAGRGDGTFAVGHEWYLPDGTYPQRVALGRAGEADFYKRIVLPVDGDPAQLAAQTFAAWDGEAFALHAWGAPPQFSLHVARVDDQGNVLLPFSEYGITSNVPPIILSHKTSTSADSGRTYTFDAGSKTILNGHLRDGTPLPGTETAPKTVLAYSKPTESAAMPAVAADANGAWAAWQQLSAGPDNIEVLLQRIDLDGDEVGESATLDGTPLGDSGGIWRWVILSRGDSASVFALSDSALYRFDYDGSKLSPPVRIMGPGESYALDPRDLQVVTSNGDVWFSYSQNKGPFYLRVLKIKEGCRYPTQPVGVE